MSRGSFYQSAAVKETTATATNTTWHLFGLKLRKTTPTPPTEVCVPFNEHTQRAAGRGLKEGEEDIWSIFHLIRITVLVVISFHFVASCLPELESDFFGWARGVSTCRGRPGARAPVVPFVHVFQLCASERARSLAQLAGFCELFRWVWKLLVGYY